MKLPRKSKQWLREIEEVIDEAYPQLDQGKQIQKEQVDAALNVIIGKIAKNRGIQARQVGEKTGEVVQALAGYLKNVPEAQRDWTNTIAFLYIKYHQALGLINEMQMIKILMS